MDFGGMSSLSDRGGLFDDPWDEEEAENERQWLSLNPDYGLPLVPAVDAPVRTASGGWGGWEHDSMMGDFGLSAAELAPPRVADADQLLNHALTASIASKNGQSSDKAAANTAVTNYSLSTSSNNVGPGSPIPEPRIQVEDGDIVYAGYSSSIAFLPGGVDYDTKNGDYVFDSLTFTWSGEGNYNPQTNEWTFLTPGPHTITITADDAPYIYNDPPESDSVTLNVVTVESVTWEKYVPESPPAGYVENEALDTNPNAGGGLRIFPGALSPQALMPMTDGW